MPRKAGSHAQTTAPRLREAALRLIARHGYAAVSMRQIAAEVGVQAGALYRYTPDKQSLLFDLMHSHMEALLAALSDMPMPEDPRARLEAFTRFHIRFHAARPDAVFIAYMELRNLEPDNFARIETLRDQYENALNQILADGVAADQFHVADTKIATRALIAMLTGLTTWYRETGAMSLDMVEAHYLQMVRGAVGEIAP